MTLYRIKDDLEAGWEPNGPRPFLREGLPSTVRINGGAEFVNLSPAWMAYVAAINDPAGRRYQFDDPATCLNLKERVGWHNQGKDNRVEQLTFSGNIVDVTRIEGNRAYVRCYYNNQKPPITIYKPVVGSLHTIVQLLTVQYSNRLDMTCDGKYPRTFIIANDETEELWIDIANLVPMPVGEGSKMLIGYDYWEGNPDIDETQIASVVKFLIPRLNHMGGGHHMDQNFAKHWAEAANFPRFFYFVYNPWVDGLVNWNWMKDHMPADTPKLFSVDVEVIYAGYSKTTYAQQLDYFIQKALDFGMKPIIYTAGWFLEYLSAWPTTVDYWWARYPNACNPLSSPSTFADLTARLAPITWAPDPLKQCPGPIKLWQVSDKWQLPGSGLHAVDINLWNGTYQELVDWIGGGSGTPPTPPPTGTDRLPAFKTELNALLAKPEYQ